MLDGTSEARPAADEDLWVDGAEEDTDEEPEAWEDEEHSEEEGVEERGGSCRPLGSTLGSSRAS